MFILPTVSTLSLGGLWKVATWSTTMRQNTSFQQTCPPRSELRAQKIIWHWILTWTTLVSDSSSSYSVLSSGRQRAGVIKNWEIMDFFWLIGRLQHVLVSLWKYVHPLEVWFTVVSTEAQSITCYQLKNKELHEQPSFLKEQRKTEATLSAVNSFTEVRFTLHGCMLRTFFRSDFWLLWLKQRQTHWAKLSMKLSAAIVCCNASFFPLLGCIISVLPCSRLVATILSAFLSFSFASSLSVCLSCTLLTLAFLCQKSGFFNHFQQSCLGTV